ncbi:chpT [Symbiodinium microadriaticum]|nr:chpT [Symbiodinium microadriaticum]
MNDDDLRLAELLCSRLAHDLISPVGAIGNGLEILEDSPEPDMQKEAAGLIRLSAEEASARLQILRLAFGALGGADQVALGDAHNVLMGFVKERRIKLDWQLDDEPAPARLVKFLATLSLITAEALPRGGDLIISQIEGGGFELSATGRRVHMPDDVKAALIAGSKGGTEGMTPHNVPAFYALRLADHLGLTLTLSIDQNSVLLKAS